MRYFDSFWIENFDKKIIVIVTVTDTSTILWDLIKKLKVILNLGLEAVQLDLPFIKLPTLSKLRGYIFLLRA